MRQLETDEVIALARNDETRNRVERQQQPSPAWRRPCTANDLDLLAQAPGTDLEMLKRIQELDPIEKPDDTQERGPVGGLVFIGLWRTDSLLDTLRVYRLAKGGTPPGPQETFSRCYFHTQILNIKLKNICCVL